MSDGVVPVASWTLRRDALGAICLIRAFAEPGVSPVDALELLADLDRAWGVGGELDLLRSAPLEVSTTLSWDTVLLLSRSTVSGLVVDVAHHCATRTGALRLPDLDDEHALAAELITCELIDSGCLAARVEIGEFQSSANRGVLADFDGVAEHHPAQDEIGPPGVVWR